MKHSHDAQKPDSSTQLLTAFVLNSVFAIIEIVDGLLPNSVAILSDALHDKTADEKYADHLQTTPACITTQTGDKLFRTLPEVLDTHYTQLWSLDREY